MANSSAQRGVGWWQEGECPPRGGQDAPRRPQQSWIPQPRPLFMGSDFLVKRKSPQLCCPTCTPKVSPETELRAALIIRLVLRRRVKARSRWKDREHNPTIRVAWQRWLKFRVHLKAPAGKGVELGGGHTCRMCPRKAVLVTGMGGKSSGSWLQTAAAGDGHPRGCGARACGAARKRGATGPPRIGVRGSGAGGRPLEGTGRGLEAEPRCC